MTSSRKAGAAAAMARLKALASGAMLTKRVSIWIRPSVYRVCDQVAGVRPSAGMP